MIGAEFLAADSGSLTWAWCFARSYAQTLMETVVLTVYPAAEMRLDKSEMPV